MMAAIVMALGITTCITTLQYGMRAIDTARNMTLAAQIMQSQMEILRLQNWSQISALPASATVDSASPRCALIFPPWRWARGSAMR